MQRDYILRLIEQAAAMLRLLIRQVRQGELSELELRRELRRAVQFGGLDLDLLRVADGSTILQMVTPGGDPDPTRTWLAAETLYLDALAAERHGALLEAGPLFAKALMLYRLLEPTAVLPSGFPEAGDRIAEIEARLEES